MTLQELKTRATASELTLIEHVEALVNAAANADAMRAAVLEQVRDELRAIGRKNRESDRYHNRTETEMLGMAVHEYLNHLNP